MAKPVFPVINADLWTWPQGRLLQAEGMFLLLQPWPKSHDHATLFGRCSSWRMGPE